MIALMISSVRAQAAIVFSKIPAEMTTQRYYPVVATLPTGKVLVAGGDDETAALKSAELFDPASGHFEAIPVSMGVERGEAGGVLLPEGKVLLVGGSGEKKTLNTAELFNPATSTFEAISATMTTARTGEVVALLPSGMVLIAGGYNGGEYEKNAELYDSATRTFKAIPGEMAIGNYSPGFGTLPNGKVLIAGGYNGSGLQSLGTAELFDPATNSFTTLGAGHELIEKRNELGHVTLANGNVLLIGGENQHLKTEKTLKSIELFNWEANTFEAAGELAEPRYGPGAALLADGHVLVVGGYNSDLTKGTYLKSAEESTVNAATLATSAATAVTATSATLGGTSTSEAAVSGYFQYGTTTAYGATTVKQLVSASTKAVGFTGAATALTPGTTYHFRAVAENAGGPVYGTDQAFTTAPAPAVPPSIPSITQSHSKWREGNALASISRHRKKRAPIGTTFAFTLNEQATVTLAFTQRVSGRKVQGKCLTQTKTNRRKHRCTRTVNAGTLTLSAHQGANKISFQGLISASKKLPLGTYTVSITAANVAGQHSAPAKLTFTIVK
jgi:hypothetical protein